MIRTGVFPPRPCEILLAIMSNPHSLSDHTTPTTEGTFLFNDWELYGKRPTEDIAPFDGKIIARMPDLGAESFVKSIDRQKFPSPWEQMVSPVLSVFQRVAASSPVARQKFFHRLTTVGCVVLLCGIGILLLERGNKPEENVPLIAELDVSGSIETTTTPPTLITGIGLSENELAFAPIVPTWSSDSPPDVAHPSAIPAVSIESHAAVPNTAAHPPESVGSVWERPVADSYSPFGSAPRQPENPLPPSAFANTSAAPATVAMTPMIDMANVPISPYEHQLLAQSNLPTQLPLDPFVQVNDYVGPGMMPMQDRIDNVPGMATTQNTRQGVSSPFYPSYVPASAMQDMHSPYNQRNLYAPQPGMPIPSGPSTLQSQGSGYYGQPQNASAPRQPSDFYGTPYSHVY